MHRRRAGRTGRTRRSSGGSFAFGGLHEARDLGGHVVGGAGVGVHREGGHLGVDRLALVEKGLDPGAHVAHHEGSPHAQAHPTHRVAEPDGQEDHPVPAQRGPGPGMQDGTAAERQDPPVRVEGVEDGCGLELPEVLLAVVDEDLGDLLAGRRLHVAVGVAQVLGPAGGQQLTDGGLPGTHGTHQDHPGAGPVRASSAHPNLSAARYPSTLRRVSPTESPPNFSSTTSARTRETIASATIPAAGTAQTSERWWWATASSPVATSTVRSARGTVAIGFIAARTRSASPVDMPPSVPPDRPEVRRMPSSVRTISSWAREPTSAASAKPSPTSTPLIAWIPISAPASRASSRRSQCTCDPSPGGSPCTTTSTTPPRVSPSRCAWSISACIALLASASRQRTGSASSAATSEGSGTEPVGAVAVPIATTWETTSAPTACWRNRDATAPSATRAAVSRAEARSRIGRASSKSYFCMPTRSAWPGRGRVRAAFRASASSSASSTGSADITFSHLGHSVLPTRIAIGLPSVSPCRRPPMMSTWSCSNFIRAPRP